MHSAEVARALLFGAHQQQRNGGVDAQLQALQLACALECEAQQLPPASSHLLSALQAECATLLAGAAATPAALEARSARQAAALAAIGQAVQAPTPPDLATALLPDIAGRQWLDQAKQAQQLLSQASAVLQQKVAQQAARAAAPPAPAAAAAAAAGDAEPHQGRGTKRPLELATPFAAATTNKGHAQHQAQQGQQQHRQQGTAAATCSNATSAAAAAAGRWREPAAHAAGDGSEEPDAGDSRPVSATRLVQQQHAGGAAGGVGSSRPGFQSARAQLVSDLRKKGQHQQASAFANQGAPRAGLTRPRGGGPAGGGAAGGGGGGGGGGGVSVGGRGGFVPPFVGKAIEHQTGGGGGGAAARGGGQHNEEGPLSARTLEMLGVPPDGELPPELAKHDPKLIEAVCNEVIDASGGVSWDDIAGLSTAKHLIKEIVVWPMLNPHLFTGPRAPPKGILLFGPPGTGKTLIGKAVASNVRASFFSISASSLTSKWIGEGEKMVKTLFAVAGVMQPSVIFIDEIDSIMSARKADGEHESSRRLKTELLIQMEGCDPTSSERRVLLVGATNRPEELDEAARRRLPKQLYIPLPCAEARRAMIQHQLGPAGKVAARLSDTDLDKIVSRTAGYSGSDMRNLIQEACQGPVRAAVAEHGEAVASLVDADLRPVSLKDFQQAARAQRASVTPDEITRYEAYNARHGAQYVAVRACGGRGGAGGGADAGEDDAEDEDDW